MDESLNRVFRSRATTRKVDSLIGIISGILSDGVLNDQEVIFLRAWLSENIDIRQEWPANIIWQRLNDVLADGKIDKDERDHLVELLSSASGTSFPETGSAETEPTSLPIDDQVTICLENHSVCFTGEFYYGTRSACERATLNAGGIISNNVTKKTDILVIGSRASSSWAHSSHGRKIEAAVAHREAGTGIEIISEQRWVLALGTATP